MFPNRHKLKVETNPTRSKSAQPIIVLLTQVLSILITAPLGAISIVFLGPRLLEKQEQNLQDVEPKPTRKVESEAEVNQLPPPHLPPPPSYAETKELP